MFANAQTGNGGAHSIGARSCLRLPEDVTLDSWITRIAAAKTDQQVLELVREFLAGQPADFLSNLPVAGQPPEMLSAQDVSSYAFVLMRRCIAKDSDAGLVGMSRFFAAASQRVCVLLTPRGHYTPRPESFG
jgi:hypothetical protein